MDKFIRPGHAGMVFEHFYLIPHWGTDAMRLVGALESLLLAAFLLGLWKRMTYGSVLAIHAVSTFSSFRQYLAPFDGPNLLFFAAWPALAAAWALYLFRDQDTLFTLKPRAGGQPVGT